MMMAQHGARMIRAPVSEERLAAVWGDVVDLRHLWRAVVIGAGLSLAAYEGIVAAFGMLGSGSAVDRAYAMLFGLAGCIISGVICAWLFPPKRIFLEDGADHGEQEAAIGALFEDGTGHGAAMPEAARAELRAVGLSALQVDEPSPRLAEGG